LGTSQQQNSFEPAMAAASALAAVQYSSSQQVQEPQLYPAYPPNLLYYLPHLTHLSWNLNPQLFGMRRLLTVVLGCTGAEWPAAAHAERCSLAAGAAAAQWGRADTAAGAAGNAVWLL
jgi:hypothetical protein